MEEDRSGPVGCGCALLPGLALGVVLFVVVALLAGPVTPVGHAVAESTGDHVSVGLSEEYLGRLVEASLGGGPLGGIEVEARPGNELMVRGQASVSVLGREMGLPVSFRVRVAVQNGSLSLALAESTLPAGDGGVSGHHGPQPDAGSDVSEPAAGDGAGSRARLEDRGHQH